MLGDRQNFMIVLYRQFSRPLKTDKDKSEMKESAKMPTIKFHQPEDFTAPGPCPMGNKRKRGREREKTMKRKQMGKGRGFTTGDGLPLTPIRCYDEKGW